MINDWYRIGLLFTCFRLTFFASVMDYTLDQGRSYKDCFIAPKFDENMDDHLPYCLRIDESASQSDSSDCYTGIRVTFKQLQIKEVNTDELLRWNVPLDVIDQYGAFLANVSHDQNKEFICNCSSFKTFGRFCEYTFGDGIHTIEDLIDFSIRKKNTYYPTKRILPCYELQINSDRCLDYRDVCDGEFDTNNGDDELYCDQIEMNICQPNEFRCRNGFCIDRQFLFDGQGDCPDWTDEQSILTFKKYSNFQTCYEQASFDCDEHWCGREMISCGDGECIPWNQRFWTGYDCHNYYTHVHNCEIEVLNGKSIDFCITGNDGRCTTDISEFTETNDSCVLMIKCTATLHPTCKSLNMLFNRSKYAAAYAYHLCQNHTLINYASGTSFISPFVQAYHIPEQFSINGELDFFAKMRLKQPGLFCLFGKYYCKGIEVIQNGSICFPYDDIYERNYPFPPFQSLFCQSTNDSGDYCTNSTYFYRCRTSGECISKHRLFDGFSDCLDSSDENDMKELSSLEPFFTEDRYSCTSNGSRSGALMRHFLGDGASHCADGTDEMSLSINWQQHECLKTDDFACSLLRDLDYTKKEEQLIYILRFNSLCDSIWDLRNGSDETDCNDWVCEAEYHKQQTNLSRWSGNCINSKWQCNGIWDYADGSDEYYCNRSEPYRIPHCLLLETSQIITLNESNRVAGNGQVECLGGVDERVTFACKDGFPLNERFLCNDKTTCLKAMYLCDHVNDCPDGEDEGEYWCRSKILYPNDICKANTFACLERNDSGPCIPHEDRCADDRLSCINSHLDRHMCIQSRKYNYIVVEQPYIPWPQMGHRQSHLTPSWYCDRGLLVSRYGKPTCLCPPSFYGHRCEKHSHRLTIIFTLKTEIIKTDLIRIHVLLMHRNKTIDDIILTQRPFYRGKHRLYLNYPRSRYSDLRQPSTSYRVQFRIYAVDSNTVRRLFIAQYPVKHAFLPAFRLAVALQYREGQFNNDVLDHTQNPTDCSCAPGSQCSLLGDGFTTCICLTQQYGRTCHLKNLPCPTNFCHHGGTCLSYTNHFYTNEYQCLCSNNHFGQYCEYEKSVLSIDLRNETCSSLTIRIVQLLNLDMTKMQLNIERQYLMLQNFERIFHNDLQLPRIGLLKVHEMTISTIYLLYFGLNDSTASLTEENQTKCQHVRELDLIPSNSSRDALLYVMKRYHRPCQQYAEKKAVCFYDPQSYFCFCNETTHRASCFIYNFKSDQCNECLNDGQCYAGEQKITGKDFICRCKSCIYGVLCEIRMDRLRYSFESILIIDATSTNNQMHPKYTIWIYMSVSILMTIVGFISNLCTYIALTEQRNSRSIIPRSIQLTAIASQLTLICLTLQIVYILLNQYQILRQSSLNLYICKFSSYFLDSFAFISKWFTVFLSVSRSQSTNRLIVQSSKQFLWLLLIIVSIFLFNGTEIVFHRLVNDPRKSKHLVCTSEITDSRWNVFATTFRIATHLLPFLLNIYAVFTIIRTVARSKSNLNQTKLISEIRKQIKLYYEQLACPALMILCSSPELLMVLIVKCHQWDNSYRRSTMIVMHLVSFIPQILTFHLFIQPSKTYKNAFVRHTRVGQILSSIMPTSS